MKNRVIAIVIAASVVLGVTGGLGCAYAYNHISHSAQKTEVTATTENASPEAAADNNKAATVTVKPVQNTQTPKTAEQKVAEERAAKEKAAKEAAEKKAAQEKKAQEDAKKKAAKEQAAKEKAQQKAAQERAAREEAQRKAAQEEAARKEAERKAAEERDARKAAEEEAAAEREAREAAEKNTIRRETVTGIIMSIDKDEKTKTVTISVRVDGGLATYDITNLKLKDEIQEGDEVTVKYDTDGTTITVISVEKNTTEEERQENINDWTGEDEAEVAEDTYEDYAQETAEEDSYDYAEYEMYEE